jgi:hypothetical protein
MIRITPAASFSLGHRAFYFAASPSGRVIACSQDGEATLLDSGLRRDARFQLPKPSHLDLSPDGELLAVAGSRGLSVCDPRTGAALSTAEGEFQHCLFDATGRLLYVSAPHSVDEARIEVRDARSLSLIAGEEIADPFGDSAWLLFRHPDPHFVIAWAAAGQDGQALYTLENTSDGLAVSELTDLTETTPPGFDAEGRSFLVIVSAEEIRRYLFPSGDLVGSLTWPDDADPLGDSAEFTDAARALVATTEGRLHLVDVESFRWMHECVIAGHEPRPAREVYPNLKNEASLVSDLSFFRRWHGQRFLSVHHRLPSLGHSWDDEVLSWEAPRGLLSSPGRRGCPNTDTDAHRRRSGFESDAKAREHGEEARKSGEGAQG